MLPPLRKGGNSSAIVSELAKIGVHARNFQKYPNQLESYLFHLYNYLAYKNNHDDSCLKDQILFRKGNDWNKNTKSFPPFSLPPSPFPHLQCARKRSSEAFSTMIHLNPGTILVKRQSWSSNS